jgi:uncharacterized protein YdhG (YjbR/CyaY superfamily)
MEANKKTYNTIDEYIADFPAELQVILTKIREVINEAAPDAKEKISYQMPAFELNGNLVYYAAFKKHIGFYPTAGGVSAFQEELSAYKGAKGSVQFPFNKPIPYELIGRITAYRAAQNRGKGSK